MLRLLLAFACTRSLHTFSIWAMPRGLAFPNKESHPDEVPPLRNKVFSLGLWNQAALSSFLSPSLLLSPPLSSLPPSFLLLVFKKLMDLTFWSSFYSKIEWNVQRIPIYPLSPTHPQPPPWPTSCTTVVLLLQLMTHPYHPKFIVYIRVHPWCFMFCGFGHMYDDLYPPLKYHIE